MKKAHKVEPKVIEKVELHTLDYNKFPWNYKDNSVKEVTCFGVLEFIPGKLRPRFMDEVYRILIPEGTINVVVNYWNTTRGVQDYEYEWPPLCEQSFLYFNKAWRETNGLGKRQVICDFDFTYGYNAEPDVANRSDESRSFYLKYYLNCVQALQVILKKRLPEKK